MAVNDRPSNKGRRGVIESDGEVPKLGGENEEDTETAIETPYARERSKDDEDDASEGSDEREDEADDEPAASSKDTKKASPTDAKKSDPKKEPAAAAKAAPEAKADAKPDELAPWLVPAYAFGLLLLLVGERVVQSDDVLRYAFSGLGVASMLVTTLVRVRAAMSAGGERRSVERILAFLMAGGLVAIAIYFATTETGRSLLGIATMKAETRARVTGAMTVGWIFLLAVSVVPLIFGEIAIAPMRRAERFESRRVRAATLGGATIALAASYVALFSYAAGELDQKADFSYYRTARPGESTKNLAKTLTEPVTVTAFFPQLNDVGEEIKGYLTELSRDAPQIQPQFQDRLLVPALAKELKVNGDGVLVLRRGDAKETMTVGAEMKTAQNKLKSLDADFQKALLKVLRPSRVAYFTVGHGELNERTGDAASEGRSSKSLKRLIESQNYSVKDLGVVQGLAADVPQDATIVFVLGPQQPMLPEEIASLKRYGEKGGKLVLGLDPEPKVDLAPLAAAFGLTWKPAVLATDDARVIYPLRKNDSDHVIFFTNRFSSHASVSSLSKNSQRAAIIVRGAAALDKADGASQKIDFAIRTLDKTFNDENGNFAFDEGEKRASYNIAAAISQATGEKDKDGKDKEMRVFALGDADALSDAAVGDNPNGLMAVDVVRWLGGDESFLGAVTSSEDVKIEHTKQKQAVWFYATIFAVPLGVLGLGFLATRRRRTAPARRAAA
jgi:hypothetical protein